MKVASLFYSSALDLLERTVIGANFIPGYLKQTHPLFSYETMYVLPNQIAVLDSTSIINKLLF